MILLYLSCHKVIMEFVWQAIDESLRLLSRQISVIRSEIEADKAAFLAHKHSHLLPRAPAALHSGSDVTVRPEVANSGIVVEALPEKMAPADAHSSRRPEMEQRPEILAQNAASSGKFSSFNPAALLERDRWSQAWNHFRTAAQPPDSFPPAVPSTVVPAVASFASAVTSAASAVSSTAAPVVSLDAQAVSSFGSSAASFNFIGV